MFERVSHAECSGESIGGRGHSKCNGLEAGECSEGWPECGRHGGEEKEVMEKPAEPVPKGPNGPGSVSGVN